MNMGQAIICTNDDQSCVTWLKRVNNSVVAYNKLDLNEWKSMKYPTTEKIVSLYKVCYEQ